MTLASLIRRIATPVVLLHAFAAVAAPALGLEELHARGGCPQFAAKAEAGGQLRVAYLGGSITAADGWRVLTTQYFQQRYPKAHIEEIFAAVPGTGSDLGVFRVGRDVLQHQPDLVFVEFAVNDEKTPPERIHQTMEGILRQVWAACSSCDVCFVYTVQKSSVGALVEGRFQSSAQAMEDVAEHYDIPSIHLGVEVASRLQKGALVVQKTGAAPLKDGTLVFTRDGTHPTPAGHELYEQVIQRDWPPIEGKPLVGPHRLGSPLSPDNWQGARLLYVKDTQTTGEWTALPKGDVHIAHQAGGLASPAWLASRPGASAEFDFDGTVCGLMGIAGPDTGEFEVVIDGGIPVKDTLFDGFVTPTGYRIRSWIYPGKLAAGHHHVRVSLSAEPVDKAGMKARHGTPLEDPAAYAANRLCLCGFLLVDSAKTTVAADRVAGFPRRHDFPLSADRKVGQTFLGLSDDVQLRRERVLGNE